MNHQLPTFVDYYFKSQFIIKVIITKRAFAIPTKLLMSQLELCQSTKIVLELTVFHSQSGAVRVMAVKKVTELCYFKGGFATLETLLYNSKYYLS